MLRAFLTGMGFLLPVLLGGVPRATASGDGEALVSRMIEAHGGLEAWRKAPTVSFTDTWISGGEPRGPASHVVVEQTSRRAYLDMEGTEASLAWDGERCWSRNWEGPTPPRFLALLNYYFLNLPWLTRDPGVRLELEDPRKLWDAPVEYQAVRMTFDAEVGDTPEDYYVLYIDPRTSRLAACEYIVTYAALLPEGVRSTPPHILVFEDFETVEGLVVPVRFTIYQLDHSEYAACEIRGWSFSKPFDTGRMVMPEDAVIDTSRPRRDEGK